MTSSSPTSPQPPEHQPPGGRQQLEHQPPGHQQPEHQPPGHQPPALRRALSTTDAVFIGLGSMIGAGVFAVFPEAAKSAGGWLLLGLVIAGFVAFANATSSAQLAARYPTSGGTYVYGREVLGPRWGFAAGWCFLIGKTASVAAMALTFATYVAPPEWRGPVAAAAVAVLAAVNYVGVTRTALLTKVFVVITLAALTTAILASTGTLTSAPAPLIELGEVPGPYGILQAAALLFFAFAGYARIATMGEEVRNPTRAIPRAIVIALGLVLALYLVIAVVLLRAFPAEVLAATPDPLAAAVAHQPVLAAVVRVGAVTATLGALLGLIAGIGRTTLAMARGGDLPKPLAAVHPRFDTPHRAEVAVALVVIVAVLLVDLRGAIGFSSFGVLLYYFVANLSAHRQPAAERRYPRWLQVAGMLGCLALALAVPWPSLVAGAAVLALGMAGRAIAGRNQARRRT